MSKTIKEKAILVSCKISMWSGLKSDSEASEKLSTLTGAKSGSSRVTKNLIDRKALSEVQSIYNRMKKYQESVTMPWFDNGFRILPATKFNDYSARVREFKTDFDKAVEEITDGYHDAILEAKNSLGTMFKLHEYPTVSEIESFFIFKTSFIPIPDVADFRIELNNAEMSALQQEMKQQQAQAVKAMETDLFNRVYKSIEKIVERLSEEEHSFKDSLFSNLEELLNILPEMNITENKKLSEVIKTAKKDILKDAQSVRDDSKLRKQVTEKAETLLETLSGYADCF